jgi:hypothetical protein
VVVDGQTQIVLFSGGLGAERDVSHLHIAQIVKVISGSTQQLRDIALSWSGGIGQ